VRVDIGKTTREAVARGLTAIGVRTWNGAFLYTTLYVDKLGLVLGSELFLKRLIHVQDETSQMAGHAAAASAGKGLLLDACAGQGTKTDQIKEEAAEARVVAMDLDERKLSSIRRTRCLLGGDALRTPFKAGVFDSILLDAPCSSLGILRKHPEIRWRRSEEDVRNYGRLQADMIKSMSDSLKRGGLLVYSVCSFEPEETVQVVKKTVQEGTFTEESPLPSLIDGTYFLSVPHLTNMDGFFIAGLRKV
jgi:16S rRNA (cytosine967-C5)-methyltransferase